MFRAKYYARQETNSRHQPDRRSCVECLQRAHGFLWEFGGGLEHQGWPKAPVADEAAPEIAGSLAKALAFAG